MLKHALSFLAISCLSSGVGANGFYGDLMLVKHATASKPHNQLIIGDAHNQFYVKMHRGESCVVHPAHHFCKPALSVGISKWKLLSTGGVLAVPIRAPEDSFGDGTVDMVRVPVGPDGRSQEFFPHYTDQGLYIQAIRRIATLIRAQNRI